MMKSSSKAIDLSFTRTIPASPADVFDGWLDPKCPGTPWNVAVELILDPKLNSLYYWRHVNEAGESKPHYGRFTIFDRPAKVQYTWMSPHTRGLESLVTVTFQVDGTQTLLTLLHENLPDDDGGRGHDRGWQTLIAQFAARFGRARDLA